MKKYKLFFIIQIILIACIGGYEGNTYPAFNEIKRVSRSVSPLISSLKSLPEDELQIKINLLFQKHAEHKFPFIEKDPLFPGYSFLTFLLKNSNHENDVFFDIFGNYSDQNLRDKKLVRLGKSDLYYCTYMIPDDLCFSYRYILVDRKTGNKEHITDPMNNERIPKGEIKDYSWSVLDLRTKEEDWNTKRYSGIHSRIETFEFTSKILDNTRNIYVYTPDNYSDFEQKYPVIYLFDSFIYLNRVEVPVILDNLIHEKKIRPMIAVFIDNPSQDSRNSELPMNSDFEDFIITELVPYIRDHYAVSSKPQENIIGGMSYGGLAAAYVAFNNDSVFGKILSQSGSFWREPVSTEPERSDTSKMNRTDYLLNQFILNKKKKLKIYFDWGLQENMVLSSNRKFARILHKKEYEFMYSEFNGWHDWSNSRKTFPAGLMFLFNE